MDACRPAFSLTGVPNASPPPPTFIINDAFPYTPGDLTGQGGWVVDGSFSDPMMVVSAGDVQQLTGLGGNLHPTTWINPEGGAFTMSMSITLPITSALANEDWGVIFQPAGSQLLALNWNSAGNVLTMSDSNGGSGAIALVAGTTHLLQVYFDGATVHFLVDGVSIGTDPFVPTIGDDPDLELIAVPNDTGNQVAIHSLSIKLGAP
jgi:hypothetical protein